MNCGERAASGQPVCKVVKHTPNGCPSARPPLARDVVQRAFDRTDCRIVPQSVRNRGGSEQKQVVAQDCQLPGVSNAQLCERHRQPKAHAFSEHAVVHVRQCDHSLRYTPSSPSDVALAPKSRARSRRLGFSRGEVDSCYRVTVAGASIERDLPSLESSSLWWYGIGGWSAV